MMDMTLSSFIDTNREELIRRCRLKVIARSGPPLAEGIVDHGVPLFLDQLVEEMREGPSQTAEIGEGATRHGHDLFFQGATISDVVHDYGAVCQSVTDMALELNAPIRTDDFRTLNRCLDDAIAGAVTEYAREQDIPNEGELQQLRTLATAALTAFEVLQEGRVGVSGNTGAVVHRNLKAIRAALVSRLRAEAGSSASPELHAIRR